jgi:acetyl-CoA carboxylase biotin carboxyl carrier protein
MPTSPEKNEGAKPDRKKGPGASGTKAKVSPKLAIVQDVIRLMDEAGIGELLFEQGGVKVHLRKGAGVPFMASAPLMASAALPAQALPAAAPAAPAAPAKGDNTVTLNSPMVGTFYRAPSPDAKPFIEEGAKIAAGQVYCIIEAMKLMNEVKSEVAGKVVKILVQNGQAIEFNQPLLIIDPS